MCQDKEKKSLFIIKCILSIIFMLVVFVDNADSIGFLGKISQGALRYGFFVPVLGSVLFHFILKKKNRILAIVYSIPWVILFLTCRLYFYYIPGLAFGECMMLILDLWWGTLSFICMCKELVQYCIHNKKLSFWHYFDNCYNFRSIIFVILFSVTFLFMEIGKTDSNLPLETLLCFVMLYLTPFNKEEKEIIIDAFETGIILGFWLLQAFAFAFRPFYNTEYNNARYCGMYVNSISFSMLCLAVLVVSFLRIRDCKNRKLLFYFVLFQTWCVGVLLLLSIGRAAIIFACICLFVFAVLSVIKEKIKIKSFIRAVLFNTLGFIISFFLIFFAVRLIPAVVSHPIFFSDEYFREGIILRDDPITSEKYVEMDEYIHAAIGRIATIWEKNSVVKSEVDETNQENDSSTEYTESKLEKSDNAQLDPEYPNNKYYLSGEYSGLEVRIAIWRSYLDRVNFSGHTDSETIIWIAPYKIVLHAHNIIIQFLYSYGWPTGILFILWVIYGLYFAIHGMIKEKNITPFLFWVLTFIMTIGYGMVDCTWRISQITWFMFLFVPIFAINNNKTDEKN